MRQVLLMIALFAFAGCSGESSTAGKSETVTDGAFEVEVEMASPDGALQVEVGVDRAGRPRYRVLRDHGEVIEVVVDDSTLGLETSREGVAHSFSEGARVASVSDAQAVTEAFDLPIGKARAETIESIRWSVLFDGFDSGASLEVEFWLTDTAVAFRYVLDAPTETRPWMIEWERTSFAMPATNRSWLQAHDAPGFVTPAYERLRGAEVALSDAGSSPFGWTFPALVASDRSWTLITESNVGEGDAGSHLSSVIVDGELFVDLADRAEGNGFGDHRTLAFESWQSPWRLIITSSDPADIVESNHVRHLSAPPDPEVDFTFVEPGRVSWSWLSDHDSSRNADAIEPFIDLAAEMGWEYSLVDANWNTFGDERLNELLAYAQVRGVELFLWYNSGGVNNVVGEQPRDRMSDAVVRRAEFARLREMGVAGVKVDFFHSDKPSAVDQYRAILADAADFGLLVNFHGSTVPRGWSREFPNLMTMEAVRGAEIYTFDSSYATFAARQNTVLPFTRNVVGSMDYTPVLLGDTVRRNTTNAHELALSVLFESGLQHFADTPSAYLEQPDEVIDLLSTVPTVWDETVFIDGRPGESVALARRAGTTWWVAAINAQDETISVPVNLEALGVEPGVARTQVCDNPSWDQQPGTAQTWDDPRQYVISTARIEQRLSLDLGPIGGCLLRIG